MTDFIKEGWRPLTEEEKQVLQNCTPKDFVVLKGFNTKSCYVEIDPIGEYVGWFDTEEEAWEWVCDGKYKTLQGVISDNIEL